MSGTMWPYIYYFNRQGRKGQLCRVLVLGKMNSCLVEFEDGYTMITSRTAIRRAAHLQCDTSLRQTPLSSAVKDQV
jgi:hypothetical protein